MNRTLFITLLLLCAAFTLSAQTSREEIDANPRVVVPSMTIYNGDLYPVVAPSVPKGYKPVYMTGYLRHGSRYDSNKKYSTATYDYFQKAAEADILTPLGKRVKEFMDWNYHYQKEFVGDLTDEGFNQHEQLAKRYYANFSSLFNGDARVTSVSTSSIRAAMSMAAFNEGLKESNPRLDNHMFASQAITGVLRPQDSSHNRLYPPEEEQMYRKFRREKVDPKTVEWGGRQDMSHAQKALFTDPAKFFSMFETPAFKIMTDIYKRLAFVQNFGIHDRTLIDEVFTPEERYIIYKHENCAWHYRCGSAAHPILANNMAQSRILIDYLCERADEVLSGKEQKSAHLCFGHDIYLIPLVNIFGMDGMPLYFGEGKESVDYIAEHWRGYKITPMSSNIMMIFYRNKSGDVLVRVQLNERDVTLPIESEIPYFYEWEKVKKLAYSRLDELDRLKVGANY